MGGGVICMWALQQSGQPLHNRGSVTWMLYNRLAFTTATAAALLFQWRHRTAVQTRTPSRRGKHPVRLWTSAAVLFSSCFIQQIPTPYRIYDILHTFICYVNFPDSSTVSLDYTVTPELFVFWPVGGVWIKRKNLTKWMITEFCRRKRHILTGTLTQSIGYHCVVSSECHQGQNIVIVPYREYFQPDQVFLIR